MADGRMSAMAKRTSKSDVERARAVRPARPHGAQRVELIGAALKLFAGHGEDAGVREARWMLTAIVDAASAHAVAFLEGDPTALGPLREMFGAALRLRTQTEQIQHLATLVESYLVPATSEDEARAVLFHLALLDPQAKRMEPARALALRDKHKKLPSLVGSVLAETEALGFTRKPFEREGTHRTRVREACRVAIRKRHTAQ